MELKINPNAVNQFAKGTVIYTAEEPVFSIGLLLKGRVQIMNSGSKIIAGAGSFLGVNDLYVGKYQSTYVSLDDVILYVFAVNREEELESLLSSNKDYHGLLVASFHRYIAELDRIYEGLIKHGMRLSTFVTESYKDYVGTGTRLGYKIKASKQMAVLPGIVNDLELQKPRIDYYKECKNIPLDVVKAFYSYGNSVTLYQVEDQIDIVNLQLEALKKLSEDVVFLVNALADGSETCLFLLVAGLALEIENAGGNNSQIVDMIDTMVDELNKIENFYFSNIECKLSIDRNRMEEIYCLLLTGTKEKDKSTDSHLKYSPKAANDALEDLRDSFSKIITYAGVEPDRAEEMKKCMLEYMNAKDRYATDDNSRFLRKQLSDNHYELYQRTFIKAYEDKQVPRAVDLFLKYGLAEEKLLTKDQLLALCFLQDEKPTGPYKVYNTKEWLTLIYEGKKEPSKNEFDLDYPEVLASLRKQGKLTEKDVKEWTESPIRRLNYELQNMIRYNSRLTSGQISVFVPFLSKDQFINNLEQLYLSVSKINETMNEIMKVDFSVFDREVLYVNQAKNIAKEYIIKRVYPDIILMPNYGDNGIMWQEITGKYRDSEGRILMPSFTDANLFTIMVRILGRYRWELCRRIQGTAWNNIKYKSLTSEYSDYLQFYRKNKDLSEEKKEKIKLQIQKGKNSSREIFVIDYELWIKNEAYGAVKLNKPVREMMATYCPFSRELRVKLLQQPLFEEAMARYERDRQKKIKEIEGRYRQLQKDNIELTRELIDTLSYYKEQ
ncbi:MAG: hypothetical protein K0S47_674 [Herbinix sp.]|jgi:hypothetical protein|nr:hypothetical protein [Herbinix sp.]